MQPEEAAGQIQQRLDGLSDLYNRLLLVVGPAGSGKTAALRAFALHGSHPVLNVSLELARQLLDLTERQRVLQLPQLLEAMIVEHRADVVVLDNTEILFNPHLMQDPLRLILGLSRNRVIIASWLGALEGQYLTYATPEHPEFKRYSSDDLVVVTLSEPAEKPSKVNRK